MIIYYSDNNRLYIYLIAEIYTERSMTWTSEARGKLVLVINCVPALTLAYHCLIFSLLYLILLYR